ncbi:MULTISPECIES: CDGSH iron-sulfur domain-containing protein [unclassified Legionella]|uniref:CDGSH iron-sulfur domain-containing protein n=1 Tax=unclassified Legionella TaxID=2622702 RepID=UPI001055651E|nr:MULTISPECIES: CDGSH iron-sulfur domain-containing protein [unclassified Legionella]MDI9817735.1 CDGSH iron-sulfur domain-containing protein [Legionella sp. PL877]
MASKKRQPPFFPTPYEVEEGHTYYWCGCGKSKKQPLCDRSHHCPQAVEYKAILTETVYFCSCKETKEPPLCDGSHIRLMLEYLKKKR